VAALKNNNGNDTTEDNNDPGDSVTSCNKTDPVGEEKPDDENIKYKSVSKKRWYDKGQSQGLPLQRCRYAPVMQKNIGPNFRHI
jgi:hypothetical protein